MSRDSLNGLAQIAASFNYCRIGAAPCTLDVASLRPETVEQEASAIVGETLKFPPAHLCEVRADWKFMKDFTRLANHRVYVGVI